MAALLLAVGVVLALTFALRPLIRARGDRRASAAAMAARLREEVLSRRALSPLPPGSHDALRGAVMDWNLGNGLATVIAIDDGTVSLYLNPGGGIIGAGTHQTVARAAEEFRAAAGRIRDQLTPVSDFPAPDKDSVVFYVLTDAATLSSGPLSTNDVQQAAHAMAPVGAAAQSLLTEIRRAS